MKILKSIFLYSSAIILLLTAVAKLYSASGTSRILTYPDPLLAIKYKPLMLIAALCELAVAAVVLHSRNDKLKYLSLLWISLNFALYHIGYAVLGLPQQLCPCLGHLTDSLHLNSAGVEAVLRVVVAYLLGGSLLGLVANMSFQKADWPKSPTPTLSPVEVEYTGP